MRSRYSAYVNGNYQYILDTYSSPMQSELSVQEITDNAKGTNWLRLEVVGAADDKVEFKVHYAVNEKPYLMHETSTFVKEQQDWKYHSGEIHEDSGMIKWGRNEPCLCGSGKKYNKCCG